MGESARKFGETSLNEQSSRSHTIFRVSFESRSKSQPDKVVYSTLNLVDLAGSEGVSRAKTEGLRKRCLSFTHCSHTKSLFIEKEQILIRVSLHCQMS